jgi:hypothetical protein
MNDVLNQAVQETIKKIGVPELSSKEEPKVPTEEELKEMSKKIAKNLVG